MSASKEADPSHQPDLDEHLRASGLRRTAQRYSVLEYLTRRPVHATADEIFTELNRKFADRPAADRREPSAMCAVLNARITTPLFPLS